jgi:hypothetical protein
MPTIVTRGAASAKGFGFGASSISCATFGLFLGSGLACNCKYTFATNTVCASSAFSYGIYDGGPTSNSSTAIIGIGYAGGNTYQSIKKNLITFSNAAGTNLTTAGTNRMGTSTSTIGYCKASNLGYGLKIGKYNFSTDVVTCGSALSQSYQSGSGGGNCSKGIFRGNNCNMNSKYIYSNDTSSSLSNTAQTQNYNNNNANSSNSNVFFGYAVNCCACPCNTLWYSYADKFNMSTCTNTSQFQQLGNAYPYTTGGTVGGAGTSTYGLFTGLTGFGYRYVRIMQYTNGALSTGTSLAANYGSFAGAISNGIKGVNR